VETFNIQEYLDSGVIEMYVLDQLDDADRAEVERLAAQHPEIRQEIGEVEEALGTYHTLGGLTPPQHILGNILEATAPAALSVASLPARRSLPYGWMAAASIGLAAALGLWFSQQATQKQNQELQSALSAASAREQALIENKEFLQAELDQLRKECLPELVVKAGEQAIAAVYWDKNQNRAHLDFLNLSDPGKDKQYQLWAFVNGKPVSVGVVEWEDIQKNMVSFSFQQKPELFAISLEKYGGSPVPTDVKGASGAVI
jgi:anti-sigma-K factor RskA